MVHVVAYDLVTPNDTPENYEIITTAIKREFQGWAHIEQSVWLVDTPMEASQVREHLKVYLHSSDLLFVGRLHGNWASWNFGDSRNAWLKGRSF